MDSEDFTRGFGEGYDAAMSGRRKNVETMVLLKQNRIIKLLQDDRRLHNTAFEEVIVSKGEEYKSKEVCVPFCPGCEAIALIKGENK